MLDQLNSTDIAGAVDTLKYSIAVLTRKANRLDIETTIAGTNELIASFNERSTQLKGLLESSNALMDSLSQVPLAATMEKVNTSLDEVNKLLLAVQSEQGTVGKLLSNDSVYNSLNQLLIDLDKLAVHFNEYPKDFMAPLGRKKKKLKGVPQEN